MTRVVPLGRDGDLLSVRQISKHYGNTRVLDDVSFDVFRGEFITLLGPSGSGKTTTLKIIAGFTHPDHGTVVLDGREITALPPHKRDIGMVFQNYALFPHMTAADNVAFPLRVRRLSRAVIGNRVAGALDLVQLKGLGSRYPRQLSGGQQQRIALARALVFQPRVLLMDEPLGALDKQLREAMQLEVTRISRGVGVTVVYVTHDQEEALAMSDRIAVYNHGRIQQVGAGEELYERPRSLFVAGFIGESTMFRGTFRTESEGGWLIGDRWRIRVSAEACKAAGLDPGSRAAVMVRPERLRVEPATSTAASWGTQAAVIAGMLTEVVYLGPNRKCVVDLGNGDRAVARVAVGQAGSAVLLPGSSVRLTWEVTHGVLLPETMEEGMNGAT